MTSKMKTTSKIDMTLEMEDDLKKESNLIYEEVLKMKLTSHNI